MQCNMDASDSPSKTLEDSYSDGKFTCYEEPHFKFIVPPEAPVFEPTIEEFEDPLRYISKIRPIAEKCGICKIKPPNNWQPPFAVDVDHFKFTPRIQHLNELEAQTRIKLNFLDQIAKFWELQGSLLKIPIVERKALDLYTLHQYVQEEGGLENVIKERKWTRLACRMGYPTGRGVGTLLKSHYEKILYPYDVFHKGKSIKDEEMDKPNIKEGLDRSSQDYKPHGIPSRQAIKPSQNDRRANRYSSVECKPIQIAGEDLKTNKELGRLQFYGMAGPKMASFYELSSKNNAEKIEEIQNKSSKPKKKDTLHNEFDPFAKYVCHNCERGDAEESMLLCDGCDDSYHTFCLKPPLPDIPKGDWRCPKCVAEEVNKPTEAFGFEQAQREYSLQQFGEMADQFKSNYFNMPVHLVPTTLVEKEFWRIVSSIDEDVTVQYGADLHTMDHGSGFPTKQTISMNDNHPHIGDLKEYAESSWNLNNLPVLEGSVLGHINADISGMKVPWMYVGMCFATFCWHNEDHWSYSINYLHWGEPKTWYGVPGDKAENFELSMKSAAPELFDSQPDLLHQLVTIMNPNVLMDAGVPVFRTDQQAGEFVITFPRAYHAGFNQGYNFAEAVNFAPADWLKMGRECIAHYSELHRFCVFSHDELICKMASKCDLLDARVALSTYHDMVEMVESEKKLRKSLLEWGVREAEREAFELLPDDKRQCEVCKTTCFLSAVTCSCTTTQQVCLKHYTELCKCPPVKHTLRYRYTLDELPQMLHKLKVKAEAFNIWLEKVKNALDTRVPSTLTFEEFRNLLTEAKEKNFPDEELLVHLANGIKEAEKYVNVAKQLHYNRVRTRKQASKESKCKLTMEELNLFYKNLELLPCIIKEADSVKQLISSGEKFQAEAEELLKSEDVDSNDLKKCMEAGALLDIELEELPKLKEKYEKVKWLEDVKLLKENPEQVTADCLRSLLKSGVEKYSECNFEIGMSELQNLLNSIENWEENVQKALKGRPRIGYLLKLLNESEQIKAVLPSKPSLKSCLRRGKDWIAKVKAVHDQKTYPFIDVMEDLVNKGKGLSLELALLNQMQMTLTKTKIWKEKASKVFFLKNSIYSLFEILTPRTQVGINCYKNRIKRKESNSSEEPLLSTIKLSGSVKQADIEEAYTFALKKEMELICELRLENVQKKKLNSPDTKYCICQKVSSGSMMLECSLCRDMFHLTCVTLTRVNGRTRREILDTKVICPSCTRSNRPNLDELQKLLLELKSIRTRFPEGEAFQCLMHRALTWQARAKILLSAEEMKVALSRADFLLRQKNKVKVGNNNNNELQKSGKTSPTNAPEETISELSELNNDNSDNIANSALATKPFSFKKPLSKAPRFTKIPAVTISSEGRLLLKEMLTEGDLLEVELEETDSIWRILQLLVSQRNLEKRLEKEASLSSSNKSPTKRASRSDGSEQAANPRKKFKGKPTKEMKDKKQDKGYHGETGGSGGSDSGGEAVQQNEDDCAAELCRRPEGDEVDWVQCDGGCEQWFHMDCVGLGKTDLAEDEDYICKKCSPPPPLPPPPPTAPLTADVDFLDLSLPLPSIKQEIHFNTDVELHLNQDTTTDIFLTDGETSQPSVPT